MRFLFLVGTLGCAGVTLFRRFRFSTHWAAHPHGDWLIILGGGALALVAADLLLNTRPVPGDEHAGFLEWAMRLAGAAAAGVAFWLSQG